MQAVKEDDAILLLELLKSGADQEGDPPLLIWAVENDATKSATLLLSLAPLHYLGEKDSAGRDALKRAVQGENAEMVALLLEYGADQTEASPGARGAETRGKESAALPRSR